MNQVAQVQNTSVAAPAVNYFESYGEAVSQKSIVGKLLKFSKGDYLAGENNDEVEVGTQLVANMNELMVGWIRWQDNKPTDQVMGRVSDGYQPPKRNELGDNDKDQWDVDDQGKQRDPWQFSNYLLMKDVSGDQLYTFTASSKGGLNAIGELCKAYGKAMRQRPDELPIVSLNAGSYNHPNKAFGRIKFPKLDLTGWAPAAEFAKALAGAAADNAADEKAEQSGAQETTPKGKAATAKAAAAPTRF